MRHILRKNFYLLLGHGCVALGTVGAFVPGLPTVVFLLIAAWAYARSCPHLREKIRQHPKFGQAVRDWQDHGALSRKGKWAAGLGMLASLIICLVSANSWYYPAIMASFLLPVFLYLLTRPSVAAAPMK